MGRDAVTPGGTAKPAGIRPKFGEYLMIAGATIAKGNIVAVTGVSGERFTAIPANNSSIPHCLSRLYRARTAAATGSSFLAEPIGIIDTVDTSARALDDQVWLGLAGGVVFTDVGAGGQRRVGKVVKVGVAGVGLIAFDGAPPTGKHFLSGSAVVLNAASSVAISPATLGINLGTNRAFASLIETEAAEGISSAVMAAGTLTISTIGAVAADRDVAFQIEVG